MNAANEEKFYMKAGVDSESLILKPELKGIHLKREQTGLAGDCFQWWQRCAAYRWNQTPSLEVTAEGASDNWWNWAHSVLEDEELPGFKLHVSMGWCG